MRTKTPAANQFIGLTGASGALACVSNEPLTAGRVVVVVTSSSFSRRFPLPREFVPGAGGIPRSRGEIYYQNIPIALAAIMGVDEPPTGLGLD